MERLTKYEREQIRSLTKEEVHGYHPDQNYMPPDTYVPSDALVYRDNAITSLLNDLDAADEEILRMHDCADENTSLRDSNDRLRTLARRLYGRAIEGDEFTDNDFAELRSFSLIDDDGLPAYDDEEVDQ